MRRTICVFIGLVAAAIAGPVIAHALAQPQASRVVDRIVAHIEGDIILQSQLRELGAFQQLIEGRAESDDRLIAEIIEQWVVQTEATASHVPQPAQSEVARETARLAAQFKNPEAYNAKLDELGLSATQVRQLLARQIYVERYLDYKFRPSVQIESVDIENYYQKELLPELARKNQPAPRLADVEGQIRELLTQRGITVLAAKWLDETKSRLKMDLTLPGTKP
jgi:parvulin-like peptidyl-prolyl isomerase